MLIFKFAIFGLAIQSIATLKINICNCTQLTSLGILEDPNSEECTTGTRLQPNTEINYNLYTSIQETLKFKGYLCSAWTRRRTATTYFFGGINTYDSTIPRTVEPEMCLQMHKNLDCYGNKISNSDNRWSFESEPTGKSQWMATIQDDIQNCIIEEVILTQNCENCTIFSPIKELSINNSYAIHNHITIAWEPLLSKFKKECEITEIHSGPGQLINSTTQENLVHVIYNSRSTTMHSYMKSNPAITTNYSSSPRPNSILSSLLQPRLINR